LCVIDHNEHLEAEIYKLDITWRDSESAQVTPSSACEQNARQERKVCQRSTRPGCVLQMNFANSQEIVAISDPAQ